MPRTALLRLPNLRLAKQFFPRCQCLGFANVVHHKRPLGVCFVDPHGIREV
jgi:hypothetical protein